MFPKGTKRKFSDSREEPVAGGEDVNQSSLAAVRMLSSYSLQRQSLLDMSLIKLQLCHMLVEPNLCRSVLIANTVRQIQEEMTQDGTWQIMTQALSAANAAAQCSADRLVATEVLCRSSALEQQGGGPKLYSVMGYDGCREEEVVTDEALCSVTFSDGAPALLGTIDHCWDRAELRMVAVEDRVIKDSGSEVESGEGAKTVMGQVFGTFEIKNGAPGSDPALEELFSAVDASYYDLDTMLTSIQSTPKMGPYNLLDSMASSHGPTSNSSCRTDLSELDHIMEIIVGS